MAYKTIKRVSVSNLKAFGLTKTELRAKEVGELSMTSYGKMGWWAFSCPPTWLALYKCMEIFKTLDSRNFYIYLCINLKLAKIFQNGAIYIV